jgi:outer membrane biosynthesis protein TonB
LRPGRFLASRLVVALLISLALHLGGWTTYEAGKKFGWWQRLQQISWLKKAEKKNPATALAAKHESELPLLFVDVSHAVPEPPKQTKYYSNKNSQAANPDAEQNASQPKVNGKQKEIPKTEDVPTLPKLQPSAPPQEESKPAEPAHPHDPMSLGDLKLTKPAEPKPETPPAVQRPRTIKQALAQNQLPGQAMKQDGGVRRQLQWSSLDAKVTAFGDYDRAIIEAVTSRWYQLLDSHRFAEDRTGKVIVHFKLLPDGTITEVKFLENTVGQLLGYVCEEAIQEAAPFGKWPADLKRLLNANYREISFTFYYY